MKYYYYSHLSEHESNDNESNDNESNDDESLMDEQEEQQESGDGSGDNTDEDFVFEQTNQTKSMYCKLEYQTKQFC